MAEEQGRRTGGDTVARMIELAENNYNCSQIIMILALDTQGKEEPDLVRAMSGLANGCGFFDETCGILTASACVLSWYAGKGSDREEESEKLLPMLQELGDWFRKEIEGTFESTRCSDIVGDLVGTTEGKEICGRLLLKTHKKTFELLDSYGFMTQ